MIKNIFKIAFLVLFASCVPTKDLIYLQGEPVSSKEIRRMNNEPYKLQVDDMINIEIKSTAVDTKSGDLELTKIFNKSDKAFGGGGGNSNQSFSGGSGYFTAYSIDRYGNIRLPVLGKLNVLGYTENEVRSKIEKKLMEYLKNEDDIFVTVKLSGIKYTVIGEVGVPGPKVIYQNKLNIIDAITNAGDITIVGKRKDVIVIRNTVSGQKKFHIDLTKMDAFHSEIFYIKPNDIINVLPLPQKSWGVGTTGFQALTTIVSVLSLLTSMVILSKNL